MMNEPRDDEQLLLAHRTLHQKMPKCWNAFFASFGSLRPIQLEAMPVILKGGNVLVTAPTAGGKTEAVIAPICERLLTERWKGLSVVVVTPTRALVNDLFNRLSRPLDQLRISLGRKTADHGIMESAGSQILITTPESVESLLTFRKQILGNLQAIVLDEIHLLDGSPRGDQLRSLLQRIELLHRQDNDASLKPLQILAMSATVSDPTRLASAYLGDKSEIVQVAGQRQLESHVIVAYGTEEERAIQAISAIDQFNDIQKLLVFVNSRKQVDTAANCFQVGRFSKCPVYGHHGSLSKNQREATEERFKSDPIAICVATMTLEVGIDIGDIDLVICMDPPFSLSSFLQRIGRGCRRLNGRTRVLGVARDQAGKILFEAMIHQAALGMPSGPVAPYRRSVLFQQALAYIEQAPSKRRTLPQFERALGQTSAPKVASKTVGDVIDDMVQMGFVEQRGATFTPTSKGKDFIESDRIYGNIQPNPHEVALVDVESGKVVARVAGFDGSSSSIKIAGRSFQVIPGGDDGPQRIRSGGAAGDGPRYHARNLPYAYDIGACLSNYLQIPKGELWCYRQQNRTIVWTWLGKLVNSTLAACITSQRIDVTDGPFHLSLKCETQDALPCILQAIDDAVDSNPLGTLKPEQLADLGPHFRLLSGIQQQESREDWLDKVFLRHWRDGIETIHDLPIDSEIGLILQQLT
ncbi:MAG: DEAD/DEAH box helicase [Pseudomonadota bacterium]